MTAIAPASALLVLVLLAGCATTQAPPAAETSPPEASTPAASASPTPTPDETWAAPEEGEVLGANQLHDRLPGYWTGDWGDIVFRYEPDGTVVGAYAWDDGMVIGRLEGEVLVGWWCETPSRLPDIDAGSVEMRLVDDGTGTSIDGRWTYGVSDGTWDEGWDIDAISEEAPPADLVARLDHVVEECLPG